ncbi:MAG: hypothetical protein KF905_07830 [Flavobacteriales bacterium]|nr:hypothetical protein [Flavobacteriales bacterium]
MQLDPATLIVALLSISLLASPFLLDMLSRRKKSRLLLRALQDLAQKNQCTVHQHGICGQHAFGIDEQRNMLFHLDQEQPQATAQVVELGHVKLASAVPVAAKAGSGLAQGQHERVELHLMPRQVHQAPIRVVLHQASHGAPTGDELPFAQDWAQRINARL